MSEQNNLESELKAEIERLELFARDVRRKIEHVHSDADKKVLNDQLGETYARIEQLRQRLRA